ncbi:putative 4-hydroxyphenylacetate permease hpaX [Escherichia coli]|nr:putative 4-hydroxyphenylacetate permease hpaX [Escherichia coli]
MKKINHWINGKNVAGNDYFQTTNPATGEVLADVASGGEAEINQAVAAAKEAFPKWANLPMKERARLMRRLGDLIDQNVPEIAAMETADTGLPIHQTKNVLIPRASHNFEFFAEVCQQMNGKTYPVDDKMLNYTLVQPVVTMMLGSILSGYILALDGLWNLKGWQWLFLLEGLPSVILGVVTWFYLNDTPDQATWLDENEKQALKTMILREQESAFAHASVPRSTLREVLTPAIMLYTLAYFCLTNTLSAINIWTPQILQSFNTGSSNIMIGLLAAIPQFCTIFGMIWWSRRSDRLKERKKHTILPYLFAAAGWLLASATDHSLIQLSGIIMASMGSFTAMAIFWTTPDQVISLQSRAVAMAVINAVGNVGSAVSPLLIGILKDATGSFSSGLWFVAGLLVLGALVMTRIPMGSREHSLSSELIAPKPQ